jgi:hypothetical protein
MSGTVSRSQTMTLPFMPIGSNFDTTHGPGEGWGRLVAREMPASGFRSCCRGTFGNWPVTVAPVPNEQF